MPTNCRWQTTLLTGLFTLLAAGATLGQQMNYQGRLTDTNGNPVADAQYSITFEIYDAAIGGSQQWGPQVIPADTVQGRFNVILGPTDGIGRNIVSAFNGGNKYLQITFQGNAILPRQQILYSPTAFYAQQAGQLASVFVLNGNVGIGKTNPIAPLDVVGGAAFSGNVGIGTTNPAAKLDVVGNARFSSNITFSGGVSIGAATPLPRLDVADGDLLVRGTNNYQGPGSRANLYLGDASVCIGAVSNMGLALGAYGARDAVIVKDITGNVGIGTNDPQVKLHVVGDIKANDKSVVVGEEPLRIVRGFVNYRSLLGGSGTGYTWNASQDAFGRVNLTFTTPFTGIPALTFTPVIISPGAIDGVTTFVESLTTNLAMLALRGYDGQGQRRDFFFIAVGPR